MDNDEKRKAVLWVYLVSKKYIGSDYYPFIPYPIYLEQKYPGKNIGVWHPFPTNRTELQGTLDTLGVSYFEPPDLIAYNCESAISGIMPNMEYVPNIDEVNYLAHKLEGLS